MGFGLVGAATANAPRNTLEELVAAEQAKAEMARKAQMEDARLSLDTRRVADQEAGTALNRDKFGNEIKLADAKNVRKTAVIEGLKKTAPWLVPSAELRDALDMDVDPVDAAMSPEAQHTQRVTDETTKSAAAAAARAEDDKRRFTYDMTRDAANDARDLQRDAAKPSAGPKKPSLPSNVRMKRADMGTISKMIEDTDQHGDKINWKGVGGIMTGGLRGFMSKQFGAGTPEEADLRSKIGNIKGTIAKLRGGAAFTPSELEMLETYTPTINDHPSLIKSKLNGLRQWLKFQDDSIKEQFDIDDPNNGIPKMTAEQLLKKYGG